MSGEGKIVLLIGYTGGIGYKTTEILLKDGYSIIGTYKDQDQKKDPAGNFTKIHLNLEDQASLKTLVDDLVDKPLYAIVNCAGICEFEEGSLEEDLAVWDKTIKVNLSSNFYLAKMLSKNLSQGGRFIMISSTDSYYGGTTTVGYAASKAGINSLTKSLPLLLKDKQIRVNTIAPGWVSTPMIEGNSPEFYEKLAEINPLGRIAQPEDVSKLIKFLLSSDSDYINGQVIVLDGGYTNQDPTILLESGS